MDTRKLEIEKIPPILLTGCARSGTSLTAGIVHICGAFGGEMSGSNKYNMKGMFENAHIRDHVEKPYLRRLGVDPLGQYPLAKTEGLKTEKRWRKTVLDLMLREGYQGGRWFYKGAKACQIWPQWHEAFPDAKWVIVRRRSEDIANSCLRTGFMRKREGYNGWIDWIHEHEEKWSEMRKAGLQMIEIWPDRMVHGDYSKVKEMVEWLGLTWRETKVKDFVDPRLWKARQGLKHKI